MSKKAHPAHPEVPISKAIRAGDFVFTSAYGPWTFDPTKVEFDAQGRIVADGTGHKDMPFDEQVHRTFVVTFRRSTIAKAMGRCLQRSTELWARDCNRPRLLSRVVVQLETRASEQAGHRVTLDFAAAH